MINYAKDRQDLGYLPSNGEHLPSYLQRVRDVAQQSRYAYAPKHESFFTYYGPHPCWICNQMDMLDYLVSILEDFVTNDKKRDWVCFKPVGQTDPMAFEFKPHPK